MEEEKEMDNAHLNQILPNQKAYFRMFIVVGKTRLTVFVEVLPVK